MKFNPSDHAHSSWRLLLIVVVIYLLFFIRAWVIDDRLDGIDERLDAMSQTEDAR